MSKVISNRELDNRINHFTQNGVNPMSIIVYNPTSGPIAEKGVRAERPDKLANGILGVINNGKYHSDTVLNHIAERLESQYRVKNVIMVNKDSASHAIGENLAKRLAQECDFVIAGIGD